MDAVRIFAAALQSLKHDASARHSPSSLPDTLSDARLNEKVREMLEARVSISDLNVIKECGCSWNRALKLAKVGAFVEADEVFSGISKLIEEAEIAEETKLFCESFSSGAAAFVDYKMQRWDSAKQRIIKALACDDRLETEFAYSILHLHRLTLLVNLVRVERKSGNLVAATRLACELLAYLSGCSNDLSLGGSWGWQQLSLPVGNIRFHFASVSGDIAQSIACLESREAAQLFALSSEFTRMPFIREYVDMDALRWFEGKRSLLSGGTDEFLTHGDAILSKRPSQAGNPKVWCAALVDVMLLCESPFDYLQDSFGEIVNLFDRYRFWTPPVRTYLAKRDFMHVS